MVSMLSKEPIACAHLEPVVKPDELLDPVLPDVLLPGHHLLPLHGLALRQQTHLHELTGLVDSSPSSSRVVTTDSVSPDSLYHHGRCITTGGTILVPPSSPQITLPGAGFTTVLQFQVSL